MEVSGLPSFCEGSAILQDVEAFCCQVQNAVDCGGFDGIICIGRVLKQGANSVV
jgi:hypothetical protein